MNGNKMPAFMLTKSEKMSIVNIPRSRGDSGALYLQSATAGVIPSPGCTVVGQHPVSDVDVRVLVRQEPVNRVRSGTKQH